MCVESFCPPVWQRRTAPRRAPLLSHGRSTGAISTRVPMAREFFAPRMPFSFQGVRRCHERLSTWPGPPWVALMGRDMSWAQGRSTPATPHREGDTMRWSRPLLRWTVVLLGLMVVLAGCTYDAAIQRLSPAEQAEFALYRHVMTAGQAHTYVAQPTAAAR